MTPEPHWTAFATPIVALVASCIAAGVAWKFGTVQAGIAKQQAETARNKLKLDLFDRRLVIYDAVMAAWRHSTIHGHFGSEAMRAYQTGVVGVHWLFGREVVAYVEDTLWKQLLDLDSTRSDLQDADEQAEREVLSRKRAEAFHSIVKSQQTIDAMFAPYLELRH